MDTGHRSRRFLLKGVLSASLGSLFPARTAANPGFHYVLSSCMYGKTPLEEVLPEVAKIGAEHIDIWPRVHGNQREQIEQMGREAFGRLLDQYRVKLGVVTRYDLGPFELQDEMGFAGEFGGKLLITGGRGPKGLAGVELRAAVKVFAEQMKPHIAAAEEHHVMIGIENHGNNLIDSPDAVKWLAEFAPSRALGIALAPYHLEQDASLITQLIRDLGERMVMFYAWQHGQGASKKLPKAEELEQLPGRGSLDFAPMVAALKDTRYSGFVSIFMHPVPRGIPILDSTTAVTREINRARSYLESLA